MSIRRPPLSRLSCLILPRTSVLRPVASKTVIISLLLRTKSLEQRCRPEVGNLHSATPEFVLWLISNCALALSMALSRRSLNAFGAHSKSSLDGLEQQHNYRPPGIISTNFDTNRIPLESILSYGKNAPLGFILRGRSPTLYKDLVPY